MFVRLLVQQLQIHSFSHNFMSNTRVFGTHYFKIKENIFTVPSDPTHQISVEMRKWGIFKDRDKKSFRRRDNSTTSGTFVGNSEPWKRGRAETLRRE